MSERDVDVVAAGYDLVYEGVPRSPTFARIWREHSLGADYPEGFEHISFFTLEEGRAMVDALRLDAGASLVDLACGMGGPGLWVARETGATLTGIDVSTVALGHARERAARVGLAERAQYLRGTFADTGLSAAAADGAMSLDALQYAPDKQAACDEAARILRAGGRFVFACFELAPERVAGLPVLGTDAVADYAPLLERAGFDVLAYDETPGWRERLTATYQGVLDAADELTAEMGSAAYAALSGEISLTLQLQPYRRRVMCRARKR
jgi:ubiquinone/menaquinone biosynthesis C-methylase UbiE